MYVSLILWRNEWRNEEMNIVLYWLNIRIICFRLHTPTTPQPDFRFFWPVRFWLTSAIGVAWNVCCLMIDCTGTLGLQSYFIKVDKTHAVGFLKEIPVAKSWNEHFVWSIFWWKITETKNQSICQLPALHLRKFWLSSMYFSILIYI